MIASNTSTYTPNSTTTTYDSWTYPQPQPTETVTEETERYYDDEGRCVREVKRTTTTKSSGHRYGWWGTPTVTF